MTRLDVWLAIVGPLGAGLPLAWIVTIHQQAQQVTTAAALSFDGGEIAIVTGLLASVCGALTFLFRLLLRAKDAQVEALIAREARLETLLTASSDRNRALQERMVELLATTLATTNTALAGFQTTVTQFGDGMRHHDERARGEHEAMLDMLTRLAAAAERGRP